MRYSKEEEHVLVAEMDCKGDEEELYSTNGAGGVGGLLDFLDLRTRTGDTE